MVFTLLRLIGGKTRRKKKEEADELILPPKKKRTKKGKKKWREVPQKKRGRVGGVSGWGEVRY